MAKQLSMYNELRAKFPKSNVDMVAAMLADGQIQKKTWKQRHLTSNM
ncbi:hypothetical protein MKQ70_11075 [Chitinophaga sedimenti]|nr:hypothetical protein [Chitinophaga sedimenti]MCK7555520.1 hypothetical protein [Chitinophaga sedimenti]